MQPIDYVTAVVLANQPRPMTDAELRVAVEAFLGDEKAGEYAWYLAMSGDRVRRARETLAGPNWFEKSLERLTALDFIDSEGDRMKFRPTHFTLNWKAD